jgi:hypothetical protein
MIQLETSGLSVRHAAEKLHVHHATVGRWRSELPEFDAAILAAEAEFIETKVANIRTAAKTSWQASAWLLERKFPEFYSQPQVQFNIPRAKNQFDDLQALMERVRGTSIGRDLSLQKTVEGKEITQALTAH